MLINGILDCLNQIGTIKKVLLTDLERKAFDQAIEDMYHRIDPKEVMLTEIKKENQ